MAKAGLKTKTSDRKVHPHSRKAGQQQKASVRKSRVEDAKKRAYEQRMQPALIKMSWFLANLPARCNQGATALEVTSMTPEEMVEMAKEYMNRNDEELGKLKRKVPAGRAAPPKVQLFESQKRMELDQFLGVGLECPDLTNPENIMRLRNWDGNPGSLGLIRMRKVNNKFAPAPSSCPMIQ